MEANQTELEFMLEAGIITDRQFDAIGEWYGVAVSYAMDDGDESDRAEMVLNTIDRVLRQSIRWGTLTLGKRRALQFANPPRRSECGHIRAALA